jgi:hypothetical protein
MLRRTARHAPVILLAATLLLAADTVRADRWPLSPGNHWKYLNGIGSVGQDSEVIDDTQVVRGVECLILEKTIYFEDSVQTVHHYMTKGPDGHVRIHGYKHQGTGETHSLVPPVLLLRQPMIMGDFWQTRTVVYEGLDEGGKPKSYIIESYEVVTDRIVDFDFGTHQAYGLDRETWVSGDHQDGALLGWRPGVGAGEKVIAEIYHSDGIGIVVEYNQRLTSYSTAVAAEQSSWSDLKTMFR